MTVFLSSFVPCKVLALLDPANEASLFPRGPSLSFDHDPGGCEGAYKIGSLEVASIVAALKTDQ